MKVKERTGFRLFRPAFKARDGTRQETAAWWAELRDQREKVRRFKGFPSKKATEELGRNLVALVAYHRASGGQIDPALSDWLTALPQCTRDQLVKIGLLTRERGAVAKTLAEHVADWRAALLAKGATDRHADLITGRARKIIDGCGFAYYADIDPAKVAAYLDGLHQDTEDRRGIGAQTFNFYLAALKGLCRYMVKNRRATENPLAGLDPLNVRTDRRHDRRALTVGELRALLDATDNGPERFGMSGSQRSMMYRLAVETGLRANELRTLTRASFALDGAAPTVTVAAAYSKHRRADTLPLRPELAAELRNFVAGLAPAAQVFKLPATRRFAAALFQDDLKAAGVAYVDDAGRFADFHALRHTFITNLANGGVHPKTAQTLARHCTITLTMDRYSHVVRGDQTAALGVLPDLSGPARQQARATGTDNARATAPDADPRLADCLAQNGRRTPIVVEASGRQALGKRGAESPEILGENANSPGKTSTWRGARVANAAGLENRCAPISNDNPPHDLEQSTESVLASCLALLEREQPDLAAVVSAWAALPEPIRAGILAMVRASALGVRIGPARADHDASGNP